MATGGEGAHSGLIAEAVTWVLGLLSVAVTTVVGWIYSHGARLKVMESQVHDLRESNAEVQHHIIQTGKDIAHIRGLLERRE